MAEPLFNIFGDHFARQTATRSIVRQPLTHIGNENGKTVSSGPVKPNEPVKKIGDVKKSFLSNTGKALQNTPVRQVFTPRAINAGLIYNDGDDEGVSMHELKFTKPKYNYDNYHTDALDYMPSFGPKMSPIKPPATTPPPVQKAFDMEFDCSYEDDFFTDDFSCDSIPDFEIDIPDA